MLVHFSCGWWVFVLIHSQYLLCFRKQLGWWKQWKQLMNFGVHQLLWPEWASFPMDSPNTSQRGFLASPPPHVMWAWRLTVRWPVRQVNLFNMSVSGSNLRVWCFSQFMHTYGQLNKVLSRCPLISYMQRKVSFLCTIAAEKQGGGKHYCIWCGMVSLL